MIWCPLTYFKFVMEIFLSIHVHFPFLGKINFNVQCLFYNNLMFKINYYYNSFSPLDICGLLTILPSLIIVLLPPSNQIFVLNPLIKQTRVPTSTFFFFFFFLQEGCFEFLRVWGFQKSPLMLTYTANPF